MAPPSSVTDAELFARLRRDGDRAARDELVARHLPLARRLARRYARSRQELEDLAQVASVALVLAVDGFDPELGYAFSTYAVPTIVGELKRHLRDSGWALHLPRASKERVLRVERATRRLTPRLGRAPTVQELAADAQLSVEDVLDALQAQAAHSTESLDGLAYDRGDYDDGLQLIADRDAVGAAVAKLRPREREVLLMRFHREMTQTEIAEAIGLSQAQVSRILRAALEHARRAARAAAS